MSPPLPFRLGGFGTIVADPPWPFKDRGSRATPDYPFMTLWDIQKLPVADLASNQAHLYLWATDQHTKAAMTLMDVWGFQFKNFIRWVKRGKTGKLQIGMGHYYRAACEHVLFGTRNGSKVLRHDIPNVFFAPRTKHSQKPEVLQQLVEEMSPGPYLELFARRRRPRWTCWGNEVPITISAESKETSECSPTSDLEKRLLDSIKANQSGSKSPGRHLQVASIPSTDLPRTS